MDKQLYSLPLKNHMCNLVTALTCQNFIAIKFVIEYQREPYFEYLPKFLTDAK